MLLFKKDSNSCLFNHFEEENYFILNSLNSYSTFANMACRYVLPAVHTFILRQVLHNFVLFNILPFLRGNLRTVITKRCVPTT